MIGDQLTGMEGLMRIICREGYRVLIIDERS